MASCDNDSDCRAGYVCADLSRDAQKRKWGALLIDRDRGHHACLVPPTAEAVDDAHTAGPINVCKSELPPERSVEPGAGGGAGQGGSTGVAGAAGLGGAADGDQGGAGG